MNGFFIAGNRCKIYFRICVTCFRICVTVFPVGEK
jgi:hypothetical protein